MGEFRHIDIPKFRDTDISIRKGTEGRKRNRRVKEELMGEMRRVRMAAESLAEKFSGE